VEHIELVVVADDMPVEVDYIVGRLIVFGRLLGCHHTSSSLLHLLQVVWYRPI
jgi:hypothetical protein